MPSLQRKERSDRVVGLMILLILGLLGHTEVSLLDFGSGFSEARRMHTKPPAGLSQVFVVSEAYAADERTPVVIRRKLPPMPPPAPKLEPPTVSTAPVAEQKAVLQEKPQAPPGPEAAPRVAAAPPAPEVSREIPEKPVAPKLAEASLAAAVTPPAGLKKPEPTGAIAKTDKVNPGVCPLSLLLSSMRERRNAVAILSDYQRKGLPAYMVHTDLGEKGKWWRILVGQYRNLDETAQAKKNLNIPNAVEVRTPFANLLGDFPSEKEAADAAVRLAEKGLSPYVAKGAGNASRLLVGAFATQAAAEQQQRELESMGISARMIRR